MLCIRREIPLFSKNYIESFKWWANKLNNERIPNAHTHHIHQSTLTTCSMHVSHQPNENERKILLFLHLATTKHWKTVKVMLDVLCASARSIRHIINYAKCWRLSEMWLNAIQQTNNHTHFLNWVRVALQFIYQTIHIEQLCKWLLHRIFLFHCNLCLFAHKKEKITSKECFYFTEDSLMRKDCSFFTFKMRLNEEFNEIIV